ncbi:hypothetical protein EMIHUDRAFT_226596 [Emiliania huxleyi CCMP1516]|uniref:CCDC113/CCDC96 coiled-coil domain-containing protein n=2 Tax=Emiliania huxleyi TaxID=2903 RepID=A0A0D3KKK0_EMIH1|nr:hypothetical protein EMIHUDRAFT_226596 [Emiliania huxleyi CCMP1516]EOD36285.1 hypothetical protein EMIHUDRAFT_226596 [Emiliania huxleyi CCMP1516]|eukprot:XP_005788714.1 hypothetical protein EMIHUDRAFT_226596 [Emiliania huxleyi CCMP1516]
MAEPEEGSPTPTSPPDLDAAELDDGVVTNTPPPDLLAPLHVETDACDANDCDDEVLSPCSKDGAPPVPGELEGEESMRSAAAATVIAAARRGQLSRRGEAASSPEPGASEELGGAHEVEVAEADLLETSEEGDRCGDSDDEVGAEATVAAEERRALLATNRALHSRLARYLQMVRKGAEVAAVNIKSVVDLEARYSRCLGQVGELRDGLLQLRAMQERAASEARHRLADKEAKAAEIKDAFRDFKREIFAAAENSRTGRQLPDSVISQFEEQEELKEGEVERMRLANISRRNALRKMELALKQKEKLAEGIHLMDFEQLKIENQTLGEKIEERNEELLKLRKKTTTTVQVLTHTKEKLQFVQADSLRLKQNLADLEIELTKRRDTLTQLKQERDALKAETATRKQSRGLVSSEELLIDFERRRQWIDTATAEAQRLQDRHAELLEQAQRSSSSTSSLPSSQERSWIRAG